MDENYLDDLLNEVSSNPKQNKNFDNSVNSDSSVDIDMSDIDDISLDELDNLDDLDLGDFDFSDLDLDEVDFDDLDITRLDVKSDTTKAKESDNEDFSFDDLLSESEDEQEEIDEVEDSGDFPFEEFSQMQDSMETLNEEGDASSSEDLGFSLDDLLGSATESEDALFDSVFSEANNQVAEDTAMDFAGFEEQGSNSDAASGGDASFDLDDLFSALGIEEEPSGDTSPYTAGQDELDALFESTNASSIELGDLEDIEEISDTKGKKKKSKNKTKKTLSEIVFGEPDEDDFEEEEYLKLKQAEKEEKKEKKKVQKEEKNVKKQEKLSLKKEADRKKTEAKNIKKHTKQEAIRLELEAEKNAKKVPTPVVIIVFVAFAALGALIVLGSKEFNYAQIIEKAADYFERHRYRLAYDEVAGVDVKEDDVELRDRIYTVMYVERLYESYENNMSLARYDKALDALLRGLEKYDVHYEEAVELDIVDDIDYCRDKILTALSDVFGISEKEAYEIMSLEGQEYSMMLNEYCKDFE